jgi:hypothetical protein
LVSTSMRQLRPECTFNPLLGGTSGFPDGIIFIPKIPIWVYLRGPWNGKCWYVLWPFGICCVAPCGMCTDMYIVCVRPFVIFCGHLAYFSVLVCCSKKNMATLPVRPGRGQCYDFKNIFAEKIGNFDPCV